MALGAVYQLEEVANLLLMYGMGQVPFRYLVQKDDTSEPDVIFWDTLKSALGVGLLFMLPPLAGERQRQRHIVCPVCCEFVRCARTACRPAGG